MDLVNSRGLLPLEFYLQDTRDVARLLVGKRLCRQTHDGLLSGIIVETEAYLRGDPASHSFCGKTARNAVMFGPAGRTYVYLSYGVHDMLNIVTGPEGVGEAVLLRAASPLEGIAHMRQLRNSATPDHRLAAGPGCLAKAFGVSRLSDNGLDVTLTTGGIWIEDTDELPVSSIVTAKRIGITKAVDEPWRFYLAGSKSVSRKSPSVPEATEGRRLTVKL